MNEAQLRASLALWRRRHAYRQRKLDIAHQKNDAAGVAFTCQPDPNVANGYVCQ